MGFGMVLEGFDFHLSDDLLAEAVRADLPSKGKIVVAHSDRIGPLVELEFAAIEYPDQYKLVQADKLFSTKLHSSLKARVPFGSAFSDRMGVFPMTVQNPAVSPTLEWDHWCKHAENAATSEGLNREMVISLIGAMGELQDNIYEHSGRPESGLVAYEATANTFEIVIADQGIGVLASLRSNPAHVAIGDSGSAIELAIQPGVSRFQDQDRGRGFQQLFSSLVTRNTELRFRSGDHALTLRPISQGASVSRNLAQVAPLSGFVISVICRGP